MLKFISISKNHNDETQLKAIPFIEEWKNESKTFITQQTSGSTGKPKLISIDKRQLIASARMTGDFFQLEKCQSALLCISPEYIGGKMMLVRAMEYQLDLYTAPINANPIKELTVPIDFAAMVPLQVQTILATNPEKLDLIRYLIIGGAPVSKQLEERLQTSSCIAYSTFGMTETISHIALKRLDHTNTPFVGIGKSIFSENNGCLVVTSPELGIKYLMTNDAIEIINSTSFHWKGRIDNVINTGGVKVFPEQIEQKLSSKYNTEHFFIASKKDERLGESVIAVLLQNEINKEDFKNQYTQLLEKYEQPKESYVLEHFVYLANHKLDRKRMLNEINTK
jgi:o-succinylbenzoate---CoA ligase